MIDDQYTILKVIGKGGSSKVFKVKDAQDRVYAIKVIRKDKNFSDHAARALIDREISLLQLLDGHPNIINSVNYNFEGVLTLGDKKESIHYNVLEYAANGTLSSYIRLTGGLEEELARVMALQLSHALDLIHSKGYAHLDIKLDNILLDDFFNSKLADMGSSVYVSPSNGYTDRRRGTLCYMAPEVNSLKSLQEFNAYAADVYSLGIAFFFLLIGAFPNEVKLDSISTDESEMCEGELYTCQLHKLKWSKLTLNARRLLVKMIDKDPAERPTIQEVVASRWLASPVTDTNMQNLYEEMYYRKSYIETDLKENV